MLGERNTGGVAPGKPRAKTERSSFSTNRALASAPPGCAPGRQRARPRESSFTSTGTTFRPSRAHLPCFLSRLQEGSVREGVDRRVPLDASQLPQGPVADPLGRREIPSQPTGARLRELGRGRPSRSVPATPRARTLPADCLRASLRPHALANFCPDNLGELHVTAPIKLKTAQHGPSIITACWTRTSLRRCQAVRNAHQSLLPPRCTRYTS